MSFEWSCWRWQEVAPATTQQPQQTANPEKSDEAMALALEMVSSVSNLYRLPTIQKGFMDHWTAAAEKEAQTGDIMRHAPTDVKRVEKGTADLGLRHVARFYQVESDYYSWSYERRMLRMSAPSINHLCKTLFFENTRFTGNGGGDLLDPQNSKYYAVIVQYIGKLNSAKLTNFVRALSNGTKKNFNLRVASESESDEFTGYKSGGVTPFGMARSVPVIVSKAILELRPPVLFLGAGHADWKVAVPVQDYLKSSKSFVVDLE
ncbi:hypothetical protein HDU81_002595 [Chytriomyces hyalinus]|nr:hypothetical protein HDU81_002595 [Chytriomyces hyalinus]